MVRLVARFLADIRANVATLFALSTPVLLGVAAFAVDEASLHLEKRRLQSAADLAAIHAVGDPARAEARVEQALRDAGYDPAAMAISVTTGRYSADPDLPPAERFRLEAGPANAARVQLSQPGRIHFASIFGMDAPVMGVSATASATPMAAWSLGSRLAGLDGGVLNAVLGGLLGTELSLSLMDYQAIAGLNVRLLDFLDALAIELGLGVGTYDELLDARVALTTLVGVLASVSGDNAVLLGLAGLIDDSITIDMARLIVADGLVGLGIGTSAAVEATVDALGLISAAALVADGDRHISLGLGANVPGLAGVDVALVVGEPPQGAWFTLAGEGSYLRTAQTRLRLDVSVLGRHHDFGLLSVRLPIYAELAPAEAHLASLSCPPGRPDLGTATIAARPGVLRLAVGHTSASAFLDTDRPLSLTRASIVSVLGIARVTARAELEAAQSSPVPLYFTAADAAAGTIRTARTATPLASLTASLLNNLDLRLEIFGLNLLGGLLNGVLAVVEGLLSPLVPVLDTVLIALFDALGLRLGEVEVAVHGFDCRNAALVQ